MLQKIVNGSKMRDWLRTAALIAAGFAGTLAIPAATRAATPLGINGVAQWVDVVKGDGVAKQGSPFSAIPLGPAYSEDATGWPQTDFQMTPFDERRNMAWNGPDIDSAQWDISGDYKLSFNGKVSGITPDSQDTSSFSVQNLVYNTGTNTTTADVMVNPGHWLLALQLHDTQRTNASAVNTGITNVRLIRPGYGANTTQTFTNECLNAFGPFNCIRTLDMGLINTIPVFYGAALTSSDWIYRVKVSDAYQGGTTAERQDTSKAGIGIAYEYMVQLANQANCDLWLNIPINASDDYVTKLAQLCKYGSDGVNPYTSTQSNPVWAPLAAGHRLYIEDGNEVWNGSFTSSAYNNTKATTDGLTAIREYSKRAYQMSADFLGVYGAGAIGTTVRPVLLWQGYTSTGFSGELAWLAATYSIVPNNYFYGIGASPYFGYTDPSTVDSELATFTTSGDSLRRTFIALTTAANYYGLKQVGYESGPSYFNGSASLPGSGNTVDTSAVRDPRMASLLQRYYLADYFATGGDQVNFFEAGFGGPGACINGSWNQGEDWNNQSSAKMLGLVSTAAATQPLTAGAVMPWAAGQTAQIDGNDFAENPTPLPPNIAPGGSYVQGLNTTSYLLRIPSSGSYTVSLYGAQNQTNASYLSEVLTIDNNAPFGTVQLPASYPSPAGYSQTATTGTLAAGLHTLRVAYTGNPGQGVYPLAILTSIKVQLAAGGGTGAAPSPPSYVLVTSGSGQVPLSWYASSMADSYNVKRATSYAGPFSTIGSVTSPAYSYSDTSAVSGTIYYYEVTAVNAAGEGAPSPIQSASQASTVPAAPAGLSISSNASYGGFCDGNGQVRISWSPSAGATGYYVSRSTTQGSGYSPITFNGIAQTGTSFFDQGLATNGATTYYYVVRAANAAGSSAYSQEVSAAPLSHIPPAPTSLTAIATHQGVALTWSFTNTSVNASFANAFSVYRSTTNGSGYTYLCGTSVDNLIDRNGLSDGTTYYYVVTANNAAGSSANSNQASATPTAAGTININAGGSAAGSFAADTDNNGGVTGSTASAIDTSLISDPAPQAVYQSRRMATGGTNLAYTVTGLVPNAPYKVRLHFSETDNTVIAGGRVFNVLLNGSQVLTNYDVLFRAGALNKAVAEKLDAMADGSGVITITFAYGKAGSPMVSGIEVGYTGTGAATGLSSSASFVKADTTAQGTWKGVYGANGYWSALDPSSNNPSLPSYATVSLSSNYSGGVWSASTTNVRALQKSATGSTDRIAAFWNTGNTPGASIYLDVNLTDGNTHQVSVYCLDWDGWNGPRNETIQVLDAATGTVLNSQTASPYTNGTWLVWNISGHVKLNIVNNTTASNGTVSGVFFDAVAGGTAPAAPAGLSATAGDTQATLSWSASAGATSYSVFRGTAAGQENATPVATGIASTSTINTGLTNGTAYYFTVKAVNANGTSAASNEASATPVSASGPSASFVKTDTTTQGTWKSVYGTDGYWSAFDPSSNNPSLPSYATVNFSSNYSGGAWASSTTNVRALQKSATGSTDRIAGYWNTGNTSGASIYLDVNLTDGNTHQVSLYCLDWDGWNGPRNETIQVLNAATSAVLNSQTISPFSNGTWLVWNIKGHVKLNIVNNTTSSNGVVSGVFFN